MQTPGGQDHQQFEVDEIQIFSKSMSSSFLHLRHRCCQAGVVASYITSSISILLGSTAMKNQNGRLGVDLDGPL
jgi:hypothetical protein